DAAWAALGTGNVVDDVPELAPLGDYSGPTPTRNPLAGSPVIDAGDPAFAAPPDTDQRGADRVFNGRVDIGAVEYDPDVPEVPPSPTPDPDDDPTAAIVPIAPDRYL